MRIQAFGALAPLLLAACGAHVQAPAAAPSSPPVSGAAAETSSAPAPRSGSGIHELPELKRELDAERVSGTIALFDSQDGVLGCSDMKRCTEAVTPASTFKIAHSMIALESGVVEGPDTLLRWDGQTYSNESWNQDLTFRDAFRLSCVPCFRGIAQKVGDASERSWLEKLDYGNHDGTGDALFWIRGNLRISPVEQIGFLRRFDGNQLPISSRTADIVRDVMTLDVTESYVLRGKTGSAAPPDQPRELGWFVGWLELGDRRVFFATLLDGHAPDVDALAVRRRVTERVLRSKGWM